MSTEQVGAWRHPKIGVPWPYIGGLFGISSRGENSPPMLGEHNDGRRWTAEPELVLSAERKRNIQ
jgi:hypothetical protein